MKVLWLTEFFPDNGDNGISGGVEARCFFVARELRKLGVRLQVISSDKKNTSKYFGLNTLFRRLLFPFKVLIRSLKEDFDVIEGTNFITYPIAWLAGKIKGKKIVYWYADSYLNKWFSYLGLVGLFGELLERMSIFFSADLYIAISQTTKEKLIANGISKDKIVVISCGIDRVEVEKIKKYKIEKVYDLVVVSRFLPYKRIDWVLEALVKFKKEGMDLTLAIVGQGQEERKLKEKALVLGVRGQIIFFGHLASHEDVLETIASARILCHPSLVEGFGIVLIEAAALGTPYLAANIKAVEEITLNGLGGALFEKNNFSDFTAELRRLLSNGTYYRTKLSESKNLVSRYSWEKVAKETLVCYQKQLNP